jgi:hypothetical protein
MILCTSRTSSSGWEINNNNVTMINTDISLSLSCIILFIPQQYDSVAVYVV